MGCMLWGYGKHEKTDTWNDGPKRKFRVRVQAYVYGEGEVEAENINEAISKARHFDFPYPKDLEGENAEVYRVEEMDNEEDGIDIS